MCISLILKVDKSIPKKSLHLRLLHSFLWLTPCLAAHAHDGPKKSRDTGKKLENNNKTNQNIKNFQKKTTQEWGK